MTLFREAKTDAPDARKTEDPTMDPCTVPPEASGIRDVLAVPE